MADVTAIQFLERLGFADILLWLLTFAIIYGILSQIKVPKSREAQAIIAIVAGFLVLLSAPAGLIGFMSQMSSGLVLVGVGLLLLFIFLEVAGLSGEAEKIDPKTGKPTGKTVQFSFLSEHPLIMSAALLIIVALIFVSAGGLDLLGLQMPFNLNINGVIVLIGLILAVVWMTQEAKDKKKK
jgi:hypothetical protein